MFSLSEAPAGCEQTCSELGEQLAPARLGGRCLLRSCWLAYSASSTAVSRPAGRAECGGRVRPRPGSARCRWWPRGPRSASAAGPGPAIRTPRAGPPPLGETRDEQGYPHRHRFLARRVSPRSARHRTSPAPGRPGRVHCAALYIGWIFQSQLRTSASREPVPAKNQCQPGNERASRVNEREDAHERAGNRAGQRIRR